MLADLPRLVSSGVIDSATAERLKAHYEMQTAVVKNWVLILFSILGSLLIGLGIILLLAHNWADMPRLIRTMTAFLPLVLSQCLAGYVLMRRSGSTAWREGSGLVLMLSISACIAMVAQVYHIPGDIGLFVITWMLLGLPVVYVLDCTVPAIIYLVGITFWAGDLQYSWGHALAYWPVALLIAPYIYRQVRKNPYSPKSLLLLWTVSIALFFAIGITLEKVMPGLWIVIYASLVSCLYLIGGFWHSDAPSIWQRPFHTIGSAGTAVLAFIFTFEWPWKDIGWGYYRQGYQYIETFAVFDYVLAFVLPCAAAVLLVSSVRRKKSSSILYGCLPLIAIAAYAIGSAADSYLAAQMMFNAYLFILGLATVISGFRRMTLRIINGGLFILIALIAARFFDSNLPFIVRGLVFIALGTIFLVANIIVSRKRRVRA
ncbi:MAG: DUF2157 domain-containing protein [Verrucomicrobia bacterium]|nr:DUF2157 domain-containing protein [Verrucomicrobiota bacterium]